MMPASLPGVSDDAPVERASGLRRRRVGQRLGRYILGSLLGSGGAASVYMARLDGPQGFERVLALKLVHEHLLSDRDYVAAFLDEASLASRLQHPNIVHCYELCEDVDCLFLAMEYLQGEPLSRLYRRAIERGQPLPYALVAWLGARAAEALAYAHAACDREGERLELVHRDVSPDNLFVCHDGQLKLLDFGIAHATERRAHTNLGQIKGKLRYMAPEYALGQEFDGALDVFALGATLYEAALGRPAFEGDEQAIMGRILRGGVRAPLELRDDFPIELWRILKGMLDPDPEARLGPAALVARQLDAYAGLDVAQGRALLALTMDRLFASEKARGAADVAELLALPHAVHEDAVRLPLTTRRSWLPGSRALRIAGLGLIILPLILAFAIIRARGQRRTQVRRADSARPALLVGDPPASVDVGVVVTPPGIRDVVIEIGGRAATGAESHLSVARSRVPLTVRVTAPGYHELMVSVIPERDRSLVLALTPAPAPAAPDKPAKVQIRKPDSASSGVIRRYPF